MGVGPSEHAVQSELFYVSDSEHAVQSELFYVSDSEHAVQSELFYVSDSVGTGEAIPSVTKWNRVRQVPHTHTPNRC